MRSRVWAPVLLAAAVMIPAPARADPAPAPSAPPAGLRFEVMERGPGLPWVMAVVNQGTAPARLVADPRLLRFDVQVPGKKKDQTCQLPGDIAPKRPQHGSRVVLEPGEGVAQEFDPRLYCFASGGQWKLVPGALVKPHFGWPEKKRKVWRHGKMVEEPLDQKPPFVATVADKSGATGDDDDDDKTGLKELDATPFALRSTYAEWSSTRIATDTAKPDTGPLELKVSRGSDASEERTATVVVRLKNRSKHSLTFYLRRELVSFEVMGPDGLTTCDPQPDDRAPDRQAFMTLGSGRSFAFTSRLVELCPQGTFARPGLYLIHARYDATERGDDYGIDAFIGRVASMQPGSVRIRTGEQTFLRKRMMRIGASDADKKPRR